MAIQIGMQARISAGEESTAGTEVSRTAVARLASTTLQSIPVDKDKLSRALPWAARAEAGKVALVKGSWIAAFLDEVVSFPLGEHDDHVDAVSGAVQMIAGPEMLSTEIVSLSDRVEISPI